MINNVGTKMDPRATQKEGDKTPKPAYGVISSPVLQEEDKELLTSGDKV